MWLEIKYKPTALFSLKMSSATSSAGKSLISPSPYAVKMALLNAIITYDSLEKAKEKFELIRDLEMHFALPNRIVVNNCLIKIQKPKRHDLSQKEKNKLKEQGLSEDEIRNIPKERMAKDPIDSTVAFREYVYINDELKIAVKTKEQENSFVQSDLDFLKKWFMHINYFGKRGCLFQFISAEEINELSGRYSKILEEGISAGIMFPMDDIDSDASFENMNNYNHKIKAKRVQQIHIFPFRQERANKNFTLYSEIWRQRLD